ncbi:chaperone [Planctomyces bekefii]|uniref:Chaperone n=1 Tax=Planctomyces bekefii TaxID=1653850 RepID=A0A5C6MBE5_9PLAN|nr:chaperone [Planctomyces bekefii]
MNSSDVEGLIEVASQLKSSIAALADAYAQVVRVIEKEHDAIRAGDFSLVQEAVDQKEAAGDKVAGCFDILMRSAERLGRFQSEGASRPKTLKECVAVLQQLKSELTGDGLANQVLCHQVDGAVRAAVEFEEQFSKVKPLIEANRALVGSLLYNVQESYRFWQDVAEQVATAYNAQGVQKTKGRYSGFTVKA